ncbi:NADP-dependent oxidoreductase [Geodermatophilus sp. SYSU D00691]
MTASYRRLRLTSRPSGLPAPTDFAVTTEPVPEPGDGEFVVEVTYVSLDPAMRGWMRDVRSYLPPVGIGEVMRAGGIGRITASAHPGFAVGDWVLGFFGVQEYAVSDGRGVRRVDPDVAPLPRYLGALGGTGLTAYFGLLDVGRPEPGDTVLVSAAAGAVGSVAGQLARIHGCRVIGIAGGPDKCRRLVEELRFDAAIDYKNQDVAAELRRLAPDGVNVYFDNVGGVILDAALTRLARGARVVICGAISQYNAERVRGPANYLMLLVARASMTGMLVLDYADRFPEAIGALAGWLHAGDLLAREEVVHGSVEDFVPVLLGLFTGAHTGKLVLALDR